MIKGLGTAVQVERYADGGGGPPQFLSTHPSPATRQQDLAALVPEMMPYYQQGGERPRYNL